MLWMEPSCFVARVDTRRAAVIPLASMERLMRTPSRTSVAFALSCSILFGLSTLTGCENSQTKTGTLVEQTPEQKAAEKNSMEGMKKAMEGMQKTAK